MNYISTTICVLMMLIIPSISRSQALSVAFVDVKRVMVESNEGKEIEKTLTAEADKLKKMLEAKQDELQKLKDAIEKQGATITPEARADKEKQYQTKLKDYQRLYGDYQQDLQQKDTEYTQRILQEIGQIVKNIGEKEKYSFILEKSQAGLLFSTPSVDITDKIIAAFNESSKKKAPAAPAPTKK